MRSSCFVCSAKTVTQRNVNAIAIPASNIDPAFSDETQFWTPE